MNNLMSGRFDEDEFYRRKERMREFEREEKKIERSESRTTGMIDVKMREAYDAAQQARLNNKPDEADRWQQKGEKLEDQLKNITLLNDSQRKKREKDFYDRVYGNDDGK
jgi:hypothetical protein